MRLPLCLAFLALASFGAHAQTSERGTFAPDSTGASLGGAFPAMAGFPQTHPAVFPDRLPAMPGAPQPDPGSPDSGQQELDLHALPSAAVQAIQPMQTAGAPLADVLYGLGLQAGVRVVTEGVEGRNAAGDLPGGRAVDVLLDLCRREGLSVRQEGAMLYVTPSVVAAPARSLGGPDALALRASPELTSSVASPPAPTATEGVGGIVLEGPALQGPEGGVLAAPGGVVNAMPPPGFSGVAFSNGLVSISVEDASLGEVLRDLARQAGLSIVASAGTDARVTARWSRVRLDDALRVLLMGTNLTYRHEGSTIVVADRLLPGMLTARLVPLNHIPAGGILERLPDALRMSATHQLIQEQNALVVTGPADVVAATEAFVREIDRPAAQILLEVLVVEFETTGLRQLGVSFLGGLLPEGTEAPVGGGGGSLSYLFGGGNDQRGGLDLVGDGNSGNGFLNFWSDLLGIRSIGRLPTDFSFRLQALERTGKAEVRSRPHIAMLNGNTASISVGTSQYYILKSLLPYATGGNGFYGQGEAERFEYVQADVRLEITPWVTEGRDITAVIRPSFATPVGSFDPRIPPTINSWSVDTSVRLRDGETFMIGGLIQEQERVTENRIPLLGNLPLIGPLFRNTHREKRTGELVIFITPHVITDAKGTSARGTAEQLRDRLAPYGSVSSTPALPDRSW